MATRLARRHRVFAVVALVAVLVALLGPWRTAVQAAPTTEPSPPGRNPDLEFPTEPLKAQLPNVAFPVTLVGETTVEDVKVFNDGGSSVLVSDVTVSGDEFRVAMNGCENVNLGPQESCTIAVAFSPASESEVDGLLTAMVDGEPLTSQLTGTGVGVPSSVPPPATSPATTGAPGTDPVPPVSTVPSPPTTGDTVPTDPGEESEDLNARKRECERIARRAEVRYPDALEMTVGRESSVTVTVTLEGEPPPSSVEGTPDTVVDFFQYSVKHCRQSP